MTDTDTDTDVDTIDLGDLRHWTHGPPLDLFARLRRERPVHWSDFASEPNERGFWSLTRAEDIAAALRDPSTFSSERMGAFIFDEVGLPLEVQQQQLVSMDPPRHDEMRGFFNRALTPRRVAEREDKIREIVRAVFDDVEEMDSVDLVSDIASKVPARVIADVLGVPFRDVPRVIELSDRLVAFFTPGGPTGDGTRDEYEGMQLLGEYLALVEPLAEARRLNPTSDLTSILVNADIAGEPLSDVDLATFWGQMMFAGSDSTRATYTSGMHALMSFPDQRRRLLNEPELISAAVEETLRCFPAFNHFRRTANRDVDVQGQPIAEGDKVVLWYVSGNYDEQLHQDPARFDIGRERPGDHQALGGGVHFCLGASLARLELRVWFEETLRRYPEMELLDEPTHLQSLWVNQYESMPVRLGARADI